MGLLSTCLERSTFSFIENMKVNSERIVKCYVGNASNTNFKWK